MQPLEFTTHHIDSRDGSVFAVARAFTFDDWTHTYRDGFNDVFVGKRGGHKTWEVSSREAGNQITLHSRHHDLAKALAAAVLVARAKYGDIGCKYHPSEPVRDVLDGDQLCQRCCDAWVRGEAA